MTRTGRPLKVAVTTKPLDNWNSGSGHHLDELLTHVLDIADREYPDGFDFTFVHYNKSENPLYKRVHELLIPRNPFSASRALGRQNFDIIHYTPLSIFAPIWVKSPKKTATIHGIEERLFPQGYPLHHRLHEYYLHPAYMR
ncbi:MAG: glycosyltransferase family 1 protein, partial [Spirochaetales bacterium]|nr:glycosyltransferase family 1 protein [Spirochaetales bacterium]